MSQFQFLAIEWGDIASAAMRAEAQVQSDPCAACFYCRRALELGVNWLYRHDDRWRRCASCSTWDSAKVRGDGIGIGATGQCAPGA